jgi:uncharacterized protein (TIGR02599 family)
VAFDIITKNLAQASLNTYWDYDYEDNIVTNYKRTSELHIKTFNARDLSSEIPGTFSGHAIAFQAPLGFSNQFRNLNNLFNARGYFVLYGGDRDFTPKILQSKLAEKFRYRLMEYRPPAEDNQIYVDGNEEREQGKDADYTKWFRYDMREFSHPLAENIITIVISPRDTLETTADDVRSTYSRIARDYTFDSNTNPDARYVQQVPPLIRVTMVAIDEASAVKLEAIGQGENLVPNNLFTDSGLFDDDVNKLTKELQEHEPPINHKVFSTMVAIRSSKWSTYVP